MPERRNPSTGALLAQGREAIDRLAGEPRREAAADLAAVPLSALPLAGVQRGDRPLRLFADRFAALVAREINHA